VAIAEPALVTVQETLIGRFALAEAGIEIALTIRSG
jgi:hypothetical protein